MNKCFSNVLSRAISFLSWLRLVRVYINAPNCISDTLIACINDADVIIFYACECAVCMWVCVGPFFFSCCPPRGACARCRRQHFKYYLLILLQLRVFFFDGFGATKNCVRLYVKTVACFNLFVVAAMWIRRNTSTVMIFQINTGKEKRKKRHTNAAKLSNES